MLRAHTVIESVTDAHNIKQIFNGASKRSKLFLRKIELFNSIIIATQTTQY